MGDGHQAPIRGESEFFSVVLHSNNKKSELIDYKEGAVWTYCFLWTELLFWIENYLPVTCREP